MTTLEKLSNHIAQMAPHHRAREGGRLLIEAEDEIERLEKENALLKSALIRIRDLCQQTCVSFEDQSFQATTIAQEALSK